MASQAQKTRQLLEIEAPGDRKPSEYLRHLQSLAGNTANDAIIKSLWTSRLPHQTQAILASQPHADLSQLAILADAINDTTPNYASVSGIKESAENNKLHAQVKALSQKLERVMRILESDRQRAYSPVVPGQASGNRRTTTRSPSPEIYRGKSNDVCYYHAKHGSRARKCAQPCTFTSNDGSTHDARPFAKKHPPRASCNEIYGPAQPGSNAPGKQATKRFVGPSKKTDARRWKQCCMECQRNYGPQYPARHLNEITNLKHTLNPLDSKQSKRFKKSRPTAPAKRINKHTFICQELKDAKYVFIRRGPQAGSWQSLYEGPYQVIERENKKFVVQVRGRKETVTIDQLKPAYVITDDANVPGLPTTAR